MNDIFCKVILLAIMANSSMATEAIDAASYAPPVSPMASVGNVLFALAGMILLIFLLAYGAKRLQNMQPVSGQHIKTLTSVSIGLKEKIALIQVGEQQLLIGVTSHSINTLLVLETPLDLNAQNSESPVFQQILKKALHNRKT